MTTITILLHEIPHEISDFAILLRADFGKTNAILAQVKSSNSKLANQNYYSLQLTTAAFGVLGSLVALHLHTSNVPVIETLLPFTAGGFLNIALTELLPEISAETSPV